MPKLPLILGGSADLTGSNNTKFQGAGVFCKEDYKGRYINYGISRTRNGRYYQWHNEK